MNVGTHHQHKVAVSSKLGRLLLRHPLRPGPSRHSSSHRSARGLLVDRYKCHCTATRPPDSRPRTRQPSIVGLTCKPACHNRRNGRDLYWGRCRRLRIQLDRWCSQTSRTCRPNSLRWRHTSSHKLHSWTGQISGWCKRLHKLLAKTRRTACHLCQVRLPWRPHLRRLPCRLRPVHRRHRRHQRERKPMN